MRAFVFFMFLFTSQICFSQSDTTALLKEAQAKLEKGQSVSLVLTDPAYLVLHPRTAFRELIKKYCSTGILSITTKNEPGKKIKVKVTVKDNKGLPVANALVYLYQTDARGWYAADAPHILAYEGDTRHARLFGYVKTDKNGQFELHTVKPSGYPQSDLPAHIHVHVMATGYTSYVTEFLFDDDERLKGTIRQQAERSRFLIAKPETATSSFDQQFSYNMTLQTK
jgi:protocatechuate 3,4-dioxygenase beta subunit